MRKDLFGVQVFWNVKPCLLVESYGSIEGATALSEVGNSLPIASA
jgi:hypothetical protein